MLKKSLLVLGLLATSLLASAHEYRVGDLQIDHPWSREMPPVAPTAAVYFVLHNPGQQPDRLLGVATPVAARAELHEHVHANGVMKMQQVQAVAIPAGGEVQFAPMAYHVMLFGLQRQAQAGERFPLTLRFEKAGEIQVEVAVQQEAPMAKADEHQH